MSDMYDSEEFMNYDEFARWRETTTAQQAKKGIRRFTDKDGNGLMTFAWSGKLRFEDAELLRELNHPNCRCSSTFNAKGETDGQKS